VGRASGAVLVVCQEAELEASEILDAAAQDSMSEASEVAYPPLPPTMC